MSKNLGLSREFNQIADLLYKRIIESQGERTAELLEVLRQGIHHNLPNSYHIAILAKALTGGLEEALYVVTERAALVERHMRDAQQAFEEVYKVAKDKGYKEITEIFEREYRIGHPRLNPTQE